MTSRQICTESQSDPGLNAKIPAEGVVIASNFTKMVIRNRPPPPGLIVHTDRGVQCACDSYRKLLRLHLITASMSRKGNCLDNAPMESFFSSLKTEMVHRT